MCDNANQQIGNKQSQMIMPINTNSPNSAATIDESTAKSAMEQQQKQDQLKCPRCDSSNTKFCYYNNYSLSQPRHLCKACKRYWTRGGTLRNVPVGGSCRKNKRVKKQHNGSGSSDKAIKTAAINQNPNPNPNPSSQGIDPSFLYSNMNLAPFTSTIHHQPQLSTGLGSFSPIPSHFLNGNLPDLRLSANFLNGNNQYPVSNGSQVASLLVSSMNKQPKNEEYQSFLPLENANLADNNLMGNNNIIGSIDQWQTGNYPFESLSVAASSININGASDSSYLYWPDAANSSVAPLF